MMNAQQSALNLSALDIAKELAKQFAQTAAERDKAGGNPKFERDLIRKSGLLSLAIP
ncbi:monooxygenase, partial [Staphylococcus warneri]